MVEGSFSGRAQLGSDVPDSLGPLLQPADLAGLFPGGILCLPGTGPCGCTRPSPLLSLVFTRSPTLWPCSGQSRGSKQGSAKITRRAGLALDSLGPAAFLPTALQAEGSDLTFPSSSPPRALPYSRRSPCPESQGKQNALPLVLTLSFPCSLRLYMCWSKEFSG